MSMRLAEHFVDVPLYYVACVGLVKPNLQFGSQLLFDGAAVAIVSGPSLFFGGSGCHAESISDGRSRDESNLCSIRVLCVM